MAANMANKTLGFVTVVTAGTLVRATFGQSNPAAPVLANSYLIQQAEGNTGKGYVFNSASGDRTTGVGLLGAIPANSTNAITGFTSSSVRRMAPFDLSQLWLDASINGQKFLISYTDE